MAVDPSKWLLTYTSANGRPWGTDTDMAKRAKTTGSVPWDVNCKVTPLIGGYRAMCEMRDALEQVITNAGGINKSLPAGEKGHVYIADWRFNCLRDLSDHNPWRTHQWVTMLAGYKDQTAIGLVLRLMQAGVAVRILVWLPTVVQEKAAKLQAHVKDHHYLASIVAAENKRLTPILNPTRPLGIVGLDVRTADGSVSGAHHQKMMVIRAPGTNVAFCGGVDLAYTRRDAPADPDSFDITTFLDGDWESGSTIPDVTRAYGPSKDMIWPPDGSTEYASARSACPPGIKPPSDLPMQTDDDEDVCIAVGGTWDPVAKTCTYTAYTNTDPQTSTAGTVQTIYGPTAQVWHDQHLMLQGPIVSTIESQFAERWVDSARVDILTFKNWLQGYVYFSTDDAWDGSSLPWTIKPLAAVVPEPPAAAPTSTVQMWRTIPLRTSRGDASLFKDGEFTVMAGYCKAISTAQELIWIFDQYFWSEVTARLINKRIKDTQSLRVIVILPPFADAQFEWEHGARHLALAQLMHGLDDTQRARIGVYDLWHPGRTRGIYVHAKTQTYDGSLLVCGSANINRRSLTCDTELACAVLDSSLVAQHQQDLWTLLFKNVTGPDGKWPGLDLNQAGQGAVFFTKFQAAARSSNAFLVPDPWDDGNPIYTPPNIPPKTVVLPNGVPREAAWPGPAYEVMYGEVLDPGSLDPVFERDVHEKPPRPARLDDVVARVDIWPRRQASLARGSVITSPTVLYSEGPNHYEFTENAEWWKQMCLAFPCFLQFPMHWPGYATQIDEVDFGSHHVVIQIWKGWCEKFAGLKKMPGGVGAEVGVYRRIPHDQLPLPESLPVALDQLPLPRTVPQDLRTWGPVVIPILQSLNDNDFWWPFPELNSKITFSFINPMNNQEVFSTHEEDTWWACKWMVFDSYDRYKAANPTPAQDGIDIFSPYPKYIVKYTIEGEIDGLSYHKDGTF